MNEYVREANALARIKYKKVIVFVEGYLRANEYIQGTEVMVYPDYPTGYIAEVGVFPQDALIFKISENINYVYLSKKVCRGFARSGRMILI